MLKFLTLAGFIVLTAYVGSVIALYLLQEKFIFPTPTGSLPEIADPVFETVKLQTGDGEELTAFYHPPEKKEPVIVLFHGNGDHLLNLKIKGESVAEAGFGVLVATYRGYPGSSGSPSEKGLIKDGLAAFDFVLDKSDGPIGLYAHSLGAGVAVQIANQRDPYALVLESPFDSLKAVAQRRFPWAPVSFLIKHPFRSDEIINQIKAPILIMHGDKDQVIPIGHGKNLYKKANDQAEFFAIKNAGHNDLALFGTIEKTVAFFKAQKPEN